MYLMSSDNIGKFKVGIDQCNLIQHFFLFVIGYIKVSITAATKKQQYYVVDMSLREKM